MTTRRGRPARQNRARSAIAALLALVLVASAAWARSLSDQEKATLAATLKSFDAAVREGNFARVAQTIPPKLIGILARRAAATPDQMVASMIQSMQELWKRGGFKIELQEFDLGSADHKELASGAPYVLIPTQTVIAFGSRREHERSHTLALLEEGRWFLLRVNDAQQHQLLREAYPEFRDVELPRGFTETLNP